MRLSLHGQKLFGVGQQKAEVFPISNLAQTSPRDPLPSPSFDHNHDQISTLHRPAFWTGEADCWRNIDYYVRRSQDELRIKATSRPFCKTVQGQWIRGGACYYARARKRGCSERGIGRVERRFANWRRHNRQECEAMD